MPYKQHDQIGVMFWGYATSEVINTFRSVHHLSRKSFQCSAVSIAYISDLNLFCISKEQSSFALHMCLVDAGHLVVLQESFCGEDCTQIQLQE